MQTSLDLICTECNDTFDSASSLLQHFANHAIKHLQIEITSIQTSVDSKKNKIPNLYPINMIYDTGVNETDRGSDSGIEDVNPLKFCLVTMDEKEKIKSNVNQRQHETDNIKKYQCTYCLKRFGWSTDLKRHILIHTETPKENPPFSQS
ncbi:uncharacterized protein LOC108911901 isoform X2 [Anoplophora glabripennis]|uniref:uncharacterized protein LOC108911901 isoform X2 n=1 Tax=Anoplophora glabripennis TaxID=217634 RepID=UPI0008736461|nr:uncharacterized protein LOC108911901 isoform X2 [Anoplophora glabripennis]